LSIECGGLEESVLESSRVRITKLAVPNGIFIILMDLEASWLLSPCTRSMRAKPSQHGR